MVQSEPQPMVQSEHQQMVQSEPRQMVQSDPLESQQESEQLFDPNDQRIEIGIEDPLQQTNEIKIQDNSLSQPQPLMGEPSLMS